MSRRNGESLARAVAGRLKGGSPGPATLEQWRQLLESRAGWSLVRGALFEFKSGDRLELKEGMPSEEWIARMAAIEVKPLSEGMPPEVQRILASDAAEAAKSWWRKHGV